MNESANRKVALGLSGGVDSAVCAHLLMEQGYEMSAVFLECWNEPGCRTDEDRKDALAVALKLKIPFQVLDFKQEYRQRVLSYFLAEYQAGRTPNPDVMCNREIKFGLFYEWAMAQGFDAIATGHYARITPVDGSLQLAIPADTHKDQTYFLSQIRQDQLAHVIFPLADMTKSAVRQLAETYQLPNAHKKDSVGICFIGDINVKSFLKEHLGENPGEVVDTSGNVIGTHQGLWFYTIGQRHGFTIQQSSLVKNQAGELVTKHHIPPFYVVDKIPATNQLVVGFGAEATTQQFRLESVHLIDPTTDINQIKKPLIRIRHGGELLPCTIVKIDKTICSIHLTKPITGISPGQFGVIYTPTSAKDQEIITCSAVGTISLPTILPHTPRAIER